MFMYEARLEKFGGRDAWMIYGRYCGVRVFIERCNDEKSCNMRLNELRNNAMDKSCVDVIWWIIVAVISALVAATWLGIIAVLWKIAL